MLRRFRIALVRNTFAGSLNHALLRRLSWLRTSKTY